MTHLWNHFFSSAPAFIAPAPAPVPVSVHLPAKEDILFDYTDDKTEFLKKQGFKIINNNRLDAYAVLGDGLAIGEICNRLTSLGPTIGCTSTRLVMQFPGRRAYKINVNVRDIRVINVTGDAVIQAKEYVITKVTSSISGGTAYTS